MDKKIVSLLNNNLRVIIPDFGAFIIRQQEPRIVVFNEFLKNNDGLLLDYIMKTENVECDVAQQLLSDYTGHITKTLESGAVFTIEGIGRLKKDQKSRIVFSPENELLTLDEPEPVTRTFVTEDQLPFDKTPVPEPSAGIMTFSMKPLLNRQVARWAIVFVAANLIIIAFFLFKDNARSMFRASSPSRLDQSVVDRLADSMMAAVKDSLPVLGEGSSMPMIEEVVGDIEGNYRYFIVAGCFRDEINADELVSSLKNIGYKAEKFGKIGDLYAVSFASFEDKELAVKELARIRKEFHPDAWMTRF